MDVASFDGQLSYLKNQWDKIKGDPNRREEARMLLSIVYSVRAARFHYLNCAPISSNGEEHE